jgi:hypothetical protein
MENLSSSEALIGGTRTLHGPLPAAAHLKRLDGLLLAYSRADLLDVPDLHEDHAAFMACMLQSHGLACRSPTQQAHDLPATGLCHTVSIALCIPAGISVGVQPPEVPPFLPYRASHIPLACAFAALPASEQCSCISNKSERIRWCAARNHHPWA